MLSWKLTKSLDDEKHQLFYNQVQTYYNIEGYCCTCGHEEILIGSPYQADYQCPLCQNTHFYDANLAHQSFETFCFYNRHVTLDYSFEVKSYNNRIVSLYQISQPIPKVIDFVKHKIVSETIELFSFTLFKNTARKINHCINFDYGLLFELKKNLNNYLNKNKHLFHVPTLGDQTHLNIDILSLFWNHPWLKEGDFHLWEDVDQLPKVNQTIESALLYLVRNRNEKSIKKALYKNYLYQIKEHNSFKTTLINPILATFNDANHIVKLLTHNLNRKEIILQDEPDIMQFLLFLKHYYSEKQIVKLLKELDDDYFFIDTLREFIYIKEQLMTLFTKPKCSLIALHNEMVRCAGIKRYNELSDKQIYYNLGQEKACTHVMGYKIKLPSSGEELYMWAQELHNCLFGYFEMVYDNQTTVYGFFHESRLEFAVEITDQRIRQASTMGNLGLNDLQNEVLITWFHRYIVNEPSQHVNLEIL